MKKTILKLELKTDCLYINRQYDLNTMTAELAIANFLTEMKAIRELKDKSDPENKFIDCFYSDGTRLSMVRYPPFGVSSS